MAADEQEKLPRLKLKHVTLDPDHWTEVLRGRRLAKGLTIRELSEISEVSSSTVHRMEQGHYVVRVDHFLRVLDALDLRPEDVLPLNDDERSSPAFEATSELELTRIADLKATEALYGLAILLEGRVGSDKSRRSNASERRAGPQKSDDSEEPNRDDDALSDALYDELTEDILYHLISLADDHGITPPLSAASIGERLGEKDPKAKRTRFRIDWLINHGYISEYAKSGGPKGKRYKIENRTRLSSHSALASKTTWKKKSPCSES